MILLKNEAGNTKQVKVGFSWTIFFFGWIAMAIRGQWISVVINLVLYMMFFLPGFIHTIYMAIKGNEMLLNDYLKKGYEIVK